MWLRALSLASGVVACTPPAAPRAAERAAVPTGAWQRDWIHRRGGEPDASVTVRYVQTPSVFGDLRIRRDPALEHAASWAELGDDQLAALARQNGFAGYTTVEGADATWHHEIDFQPASGSDIGRLERAGDGALLEHALDGAYVERWSPLERGSGRFFAARVERAGRVEQLLAVAGEHFLYARARTVDLPAGDSLGELIAHGHLARDTIIAYLDCEISYGTTRGWRVERSTLPWRQGARLAFADRIALDAAGRPVPRAAEVGEAWSFPVDSLAPEVRTALLGGAR